MKPAALKSAYNEVCLDAARLVNYFGHTAHERELVRLPGLGRRIHARCKVAFTKN